MKIVYRQHLKIRLKEREIPFDYPKQILESPEREYFDTQAARNIAIKNLLFKGLLRNIVIAYDIIDDRIEIVTIHVISDKEIKSKLESGRWEKHEEN